MIKDINTILDELFSVRSFLIGATVLLMSSILFTIGMINL